MFAVTHHLTLLLTRCLPVIALPFCAGAAAVPYDWTNVEIHGGGLVTGVVFHPGERDLIYARTDVGGAYRWNPSDSSWTALNDELGHVDMESLGVLSLAVTPEDPSWVGLACGQYVAPWAEPAVFYQSLARGTPGTWWRKRLPFQLGGNQDGRTAGERLVVDPHEPQRLFLGTSANGLWRSEDRGRTWRQVESFEPPAVTFLAFADSGFFAGTTDTAAPVRASHDGGTSWTAVQSQPSGLIPHHAEIDGGGVLYVTYADAPGPNGMTDGGVWKLDLRSGAWTDVTPVRPDDAVGDIFGYAGLAVDPRRPGTVMVTTNNRWKRGDEIFRSTDGGVHWRPLWTRAVTQADRAPWIYWGRPRTEFRPHWMGDIDIDPFSSDRAFFVTGTGLWRCENLTAADREEPTLWRFENSGLEETVVVALVSPPSGAPLVTALGDIDGFRHDELERSPPQGQHAPPRGSAYSLDFAGLAPDVMVRSHAEGRTRASISFDGARSWTLLPTQPTEASQFGAGAVAINADASRILWMPDGGPVYVSDNRGESWTAAVGGPGGRNDFRVRRPVTDRVDPDIAYVHDLLRGELWASRDGGRSFTIVRRQLGEKNLGSPVAVPGLAGHVWIPTLQGLWRSTDGARKFRSLPAVDAAYAVGFGRPAPGRTHPSAYLAGKVRREEGIFRSDDAGETWVRISDELHRFGRIMCLTGDPRTHGRVYLGTGGRGIVRGDPKQPL